MLTQTDIRAETAPLLPHHAAICGLTCDSRQVQPGWLFAALPGLQAHGGDFIDQATANGATALLVGNDRVIHSEGSSRNSSQHSALSDHAPVILRSDNPRRDYAQLAARFYGRQPSHIAAVTGTNGKTSVVEFLRQIWDTTGHQAASLGTLGLRSVNHSTQGSLTTPDAASLHADLSDLAQRGINHVALEASSHGLHQYRLDGVALHAAAFTHLSRDHMDYHANQADYLAAKARLFNALLPPGRTAVLNADSPEFDHLQTFCTDRKIDVLSYGFAGHALRLSGVERLSQNQPNGLRVRADILGRKIDVEMSLTGEFQAGNILCALGLALACGGEKDAVIDALAALRGVPGRMQHIGEHPGGADVYLDYAHTPDGLASALRALRPYTTGTLWVLFGCGGDRDSGKRPLMGQTARQYADRTVITDDNPRTEEPAVIRQAIVEGYGKTHSDTLHVIDDRAHAIAWMIDQLKTGDVALIAGKGHETRQIIGNQHQYFDDAEQIRNALARETSEPRKHI